MKTKLNMSARAQTRKSISARVSPFGVIIRVEDEKKRGGGEGIDERAYAVLGVHQAKIQLARRLFLFFLS